jgi:hypothetical protein
MNRASGTPRGADTSKATLTKNTGWQNAEKTPRVQALAGLAVYASLMEALLKRGINKQDDVGAITKEAATNVPGFCTGFGAAVEKEAKHLLTVIGNPEQKVDAT